MNWKSGLLATLIVIGLVACRGSSAPAGQAASAPVTGGQTGEYSGAVRLAELEETELIESSGLAASRRSPGFFWTHNDSGDGPYLYAFDRRGQRAGVWRVTGAKNFDWEDIAAGPGPQPRQHYLYIGDIGDNGGRRPEIAVYRIAEPLITPGGSASTKKNPHSTQPAETIRLTYPDGKPDAEALLMHPITGDLFIVTKMRSGPATVYKASAPLSTSSPITLERVGEVRIPGLLGSMVTGGDISPDGRRVVLCDYFAAFELVLPDSLGDNFDMIWGRPLVTIQLGARKQGEAVCYRLDGQALLTTSEGKRAPLDELVRR